MGKDIVKAITFYFAVVMLISLVVVIATGLLVGVIHALATL